MRFHQSDKYDFDLPKDDDCWHLDACRLVTLSLKSESLKSDDPTKELVTISEYNRVGINARAVWDQKNQENQGQGIKVVIFDMGVDYEHPNLLPNIQSVLNYAADFDHHLAKPKLLYPPDPERLSQWKATEPTRTYESGGKIYNRYNGHGTACAGIIAAIDPKDPRFKDDPIIKNSRVIGVASKAHPVPVRISSNFDIGSLIAAIEYAGKEEVGDVILMPRYLPEPDDELPPEGKPGLKDLRDAIQNLAKKKPVVCASGNNGKRELIYPASLPEVIAVGACNDRGYRSSYSNYGEGLTVVAPSNDIADLHRGLIRLDADEIDVLIRERSEASKRRSGLPIPLGQSFGLELLKFTD